MPTTGYQAGADSNDLELSYAAETTWGTSPTGSYQKFRVNSEGFSESKNRTRPPEIRADGQAAAAVTQDVSASGNIQFGISYGNVDDLWAGAVNGAWSAALNITGTDIAFTSTGLSSATAGKFSTIAVGQWIKIAGATAPANNGFKRVTAATGTTVTLEGGATTAAAGAAVTITGTMLRNGTTFNSFTIQKRLGASLGFAYPGTYFTGGQINAARGDFFSGTLDALCRSEEKQVAALGSGFTAAPTNKVMSVVTHLKSVALDGGALAAKIMSVNSTFQKEGAAAQYAVSTSTVDGTKAQGMRKGTLTANGTLEAYFGDYALYDKYKAEAEVNVSYRVTDGAGNTYIVTYPVVVLGKSTITAGGANSDVMARFEWGADPDPVTGCTMQIDRFAGP
ncbi:phage tail tube protein [Azospirillum aestuarii]|uniref:phage tail tube protein n=1 Tax=Azospirillum aestuarii TaxID=2802052 RepID=UPI004054EE11